MSQPVFVIAEAGVNHNGSLERALAMVDAGAAAGADAVKFQTFDAALLVTRRAAKAAYQVENTGEDGGQLEMLRALQLTSDDHQALADRCAERGVHFMSTAFDMDSLAMLAAFDMPAVKIPSGDITWGAMLLKAARLGRPLILSTGMATMEEITEALGVIAFALTQEGEPSDRSTFRTALATVAGLAAVRERVTLLHCTTQYPTPLEAVNLRAMTTMAERFGVQVGYSDHTRSLAVPVAAVARGATVIEKHFTLDRGLPGPDHAASLEPDELAAMVVMIRETEAALGSTEKGPTAEEMGNRLAARRCLVATQPIAAGEPLSLELLTAKRPAEGLSPMVAWDLVGRPAVVSFAPDEVIVA